MYNDLKKTIEKDFDKDKNYNSIMSKVEGVSDMKKFKMRYVLATACVVIIAVVGILKIDFRNFNNVENTNTPTENPKWKVKKVYTTTEDTFENTDATTNKWNEKEITRQYDIVHYNNIEYQTTFNMNNAIISKELIEKELGTSIAEGFDEDEEKTHKTNVKVLKINNIASNCIIAVQFEGDTNYYAYVNPSYKPSTLEDFIDDLNLKDIISFGTINYKHFYTDSNGEKQYEEVEFYNVDNNVIWQMLFDDSFSKNIYCDADNFSIDNDITIDINVPILGGEYYGILLSNNGYMMTNILKTGTVFYLGESRVKEFINYIINNYDGYKIEYVNENNWNENDDDEPNIVMQENNTVNVSNDDFVVEENKNN